MNLLEQLNWRYAAKRMTGEKVPKEKLDTILEATRMAATSNGLQPFKVLIIEGEELKKKIQPAAYNQPQILECSHLLIFAAWDTLTTDQVDAYIQTVASERGVPVESLEAWANSIKGLVGSRTPEENFHWMAKQAYIALGTGLVAAAMEKVDATPMEGFVPAQIDELLGLKEKGLKSVAMMAVGYRNAEIDWLASAKKVRRSKEEFFIHLG